MNGAPISGMPKYMKAAYIEELGPPENIRYGERPVPQAGPTDVLIRVEKLTVNPVDTFVRSGAYRTPVPMPLIVGRDVVGTVVSAGPGAQQFVPGDKVWSNSLGYGGRQGPFAEFAVVSCERLYKLPEGVNPDTAVAVLHPAVTAWLGLFRHARIRAGETVYVGGGAGNVGTSIIQFAKASGARVLASARAEDAGWCRESGADQVFDYSDPDLGKQIRAAAQDGVDIYWDTSGKHNFDVSVDLLAQGGRIILMAGLMARPELPAGKLYTRNGSVLGFALSAATVSDLAGAALAINRMLAAGNLSARITARMPLSETAEAHRMVEGKSSYGRLRGRIIITP